MDKILHLTADDYLHVGHNIDYFFSDCHDHEDFFEVLFVVRGRALNVVDGDIQIVENKNAVFIRPDDVHYIKPFPDEKSQFEFFNLKIPSDIMQEEFGKCKVLEEKIFSGELPSVVCFDRTEFGVMCAHFLKYSEQKDSDIIGYLYHGLVTELLSSLLYCKSRVDTKMPDWFAELLCYIKSQDVGSLTYEDILNKSMVEKSYLWKSFKKYLNTSPTDYINIMKLEKACELIANTPMSMTEVAFEVGYNSYSYFARQFKSKYGYSPKELLKNNGNTDAGE